MTIMPDEKPKPIDQQELERRLEAGESLDGVEIGDVDFREHVFEKRPNFSGAIFTGNADFQSARFLNGADFRGAKFLGNEGANFIAAQFSGDGSADFFEAQFSGDGGAYFFRAQFSGKQGAHFMWAEFSGKQGANFWRAQFSGEGGAGFSFAKFTGNGGADFSFAKFTGDRGADFSRTQFSGAGNVNFSGAAFAGVKADFSGAGFANEGKVWFWCTKFAENCQVVFKQMEVKQPESFKFVDVNLASASFLYTDVEHFVFKNVEFRQSGSGASRQMLADEVWDKIDPGDKTRTYDQNYLRHVESLYCQLKCNFEEKRDYAGAGDFHYGEMEMRLKQQSRWQQIVSLTLPYKLISGYGEKWQLALKNLFFAWVVFSFFNMFFIGPVPEGTGANPPISISLPAPGWPLVGKFADSFIFTAKTMTFQKTTEFQLASTQLHPVGGRIARFVVQFQVLYGPSVIALMLLAIRRQFRR